VVPLDVHAALSADHALVGLPAEVLAAAAAATPPIPPSRVKDPGDRMG
jgi:hypothetical protein